MSLTKNAVFAKTAMQRRDAKRRAPVLDAVTGSVAVEERFNRGRNFERNLEPYARALHVINEHITVPQAVIDESAHAYTDMGHLLVEKLGWPAEAIRIYPQGSASTMTLVRSPGNAKFDIDAVCQVDVSLLEAHEPMAFFEAVGTALEDVVDANAKKRCWNIEFPNKRFYLEFTPSIPLETVPIHLIEGSSVPGLRPAPEYRSTALAVVDTPTRLWKTSNPAGFSAWVNDISKRRLVMSLALDSIREATASVAPVPDQKVDIDDTLRVAIRLFKRHRDICVKRGLLTSDFQPISVILVTLLTTCYDGLADLIQSGDIPPFLHPVDVLVSLADLLPHLVEPIPGFGYSVINPTVEGENFAERWNQDDGERAQAFNVWCEILRSDLETLQAGSDADEIERTARAVFGCPADSASSTGTPSAPSTHRPPPAAPRTSGLA